MDSILLYTDDNIIGQSIHDYMIDRARDITTLKFQDIVKGVGASPAATVIINIIHKDISAATTVALLNTLRKRLTHCALLVLIVKSELSSLFRELLDLENLLILTENPRWQITQPSSAGPQPPKAARGYAPAAS